MSENLRPEWLAFENELGFRPKLVGPTYENIVDQDTKNGEAMTAIYDMPQPDPSIRTSWHTTASGVRLKSYIPPNLRTDQPLVYFIHGGGFVIGSVDEDDRFVDRHARDTGCVFVSVEYRLAPQHQFPAGFEDCIDGARWCIENAKSLGAREGPIIVMGKSAGGSLAFAVSLKLIDDGLGSSLLGIAPCQPITVHPNAVPVDLRSRYTSYQENAGNTVNTSKVMHVLFDLYGVPKDNIYIFPVLHPRLKELPRVYMNACGADVLRDDARLMKELLELHAVQIRYDEYDRLPHYFFAFPSTHLNELRDAYFAKTAQGLRWLIEGRD